MVREEGENQATDAVAEEVTHSHSLLRRRLSLLLRADLREVEVVEEAEAEVEVS